MIIFAGIVASIPDMIKGIYVDYFVNVPSSRLTSSLIFVAILIVAVLLIVYFTTYVQQAEYKIPIQYTKVAQGAPSSSYLPLKINPAGVIPVIFASSITAAPAAILQFVSASGLDWAWVRSAQELLSTTAPTGIALYALLIILFTFFYTFVQINPEKAAENLQRAVLISTVSVLVKGQKSICQNFFVVSQQSVTSFTRTFCRFQFMKFQFLFSPLL